MNMAIILSGGTGTRFQSEIPKQYQTIGGKQIISYVIDSVNKAHSIEKFIIVAGKEYIDTLKRDYNTEVTEGGADRNKSIKNGLDYIHAKYSCGNIIILDSVRPFITPSLIDRYMELLKNHPAVATAKKITDSLGSYDCHIVNRERYYLLSSPEAFHFDFLYRHLDPQSGLFEITQHLPEGTDIYLHFEYVNDLKITYKQDMIFAESFVTHP